MSLESRIDAIPPAGEWWTSGGREKFLSIARQLILRGFTEDDAVAVLLRAYTAVAGEFGN